jgi:hypothetical protein
LSLFRARNLRTSFIFLLPSSAGCRRQIIIFAIRQIFYSGSKKIASGVLINTRAGLKIAAANAKVPSAQNTCLAKEPQESIAAFIATVETKNAWIVEQES